MQVLLERRVSFAGNVEQERKRRSVVENNFKRRESQSHINVEMAGNSKPDGSFQAKVSRNFPLESLLQHAWLQTQRPKVQRRSESDSPDHVPLEERASLQSSAQLLSGADSGGAGDAEGLEETYFHKTRPEALPDFLRRLAPPELNCFSQKTEVRRSSSATLILADPTVSDGFSQDSVDSTKFSSSDEFSIGTQPPLEDSLDDVDFEGLVGDGFFEWTSETEPMARTFLDELLSNENLEVEKNLMQETTAYHAMEKVIADLLVPDVAVDDACDPEGADNERYWSIAESLTIEEISRMEKSSAYHAMTEEIANLLSSEPTILDGAARSEVPNHETSDRAGFVPSEDLMALKCMEGFTSMLSKHIKDVSMRNSDTVDVRTWITEYDEIDSQFDDAWVPYLDGFNQISPVKSSLNSNLLQGGAGSNSSPNTNMTELLYRCALAVSRGDVSASGCLAELRNYSSPYGNHMERMAYYFSEALLARMSGTGEQLYTVHTNNRLSAATMLRSYRLYIDNCPYIKVKHFISQASILDAFEGATHVHVIHYGIQIGVEYASLLHNLSMRPEGPPHFRLTGIDIPYPGEDPLKKIHETGRRLEEFAKKWGVPFEFHALAGSNWESFTAKDFDLRKEEVLAVSTYKMHMILDEGVLGASPRELLLKRIRSLNPKVFSLFVDNAACNAPFFMTRFRESVKHYSAIYDGLEIAMASDAPERVILEREIFGREILNIVACEGQARIERAEPYRQWQNRMDRADFTHRPLKSSVRTKIKAMMASFHKDFGVGKDDGWILIGIRNQIVGACSVWEPKHVMRVKPITTKQPKIGFFGHVY